MSSYFFVAYATFLCQILTPRGAMFPVADFPKVVPPLNVAILQEVAKKYDLSMWIDSSGLAAALTREGSDKRAVIYGNYFGINSCVIEQFCKSKQIAYALLKARGVSAISPGTYYRGDNNIDAEGRIEKFGDMYRVIMLAQESLLVLHRKQPFLEGNGTSTVDQLYLVWLERNLFLARHVNLPTEQGDKVLDDLETLELSWNHENWDHVTTHVFPNRKVDEPSDRITKAITLAQSAMKTFGIQFASVTMARMYPILPGNIAGPSFFKVVSVEPRVDLENLVEAQLIDSEKITEIYEKVICNMLDMPFKQSTAVIHMTEEKE